MASKLTKVAILIFIAIIIILLIAHRNKELEPEWYVSPDGVLKYPADRGKVEYTKTLLEDKDSYTIEKVVYKSRGKDIYALLYLPKGKKVNALVALPAANAKKEQHSGIADIVLSQGYAYFVIDQRGIGETSGLIPPAVHDYNEFIAGREPFQHLMVFDALRAFDVLEQEKAIDKIAFFGSSMGGRTALIAASMEPDASGVLAYSTAGYQPRLGKGAVFIKSFNPNTYVAEISPRKLVMFHSRKDSVVDYQDARTTFGLAKEPKKFVELPDTCDHGFCFNAKELFIEELDNIF